MTLTPVRYTLDIMPVTKSAAKRVRQNLKRHKRNLRVKNNMKRDIKALLAAIAQNDAKAKAENLKKAQSSIDKAAKANIIHKNKAAREKSKLVKAAKGAKKPDTTAKTPAKTKARATTKSTKPKSEK